MAQGLSGWPGRILKALDELGLADDTLIVFAGEFGRTPMAQGSDGRDHNPFGFTIWMAGGGIKPGITYGETDPVGYTPAVNPVQLRDFHATLLHLLGFDHREMIFPFKGLNQKLTGVKPAEVIKDVLS